MDAKRARDAPRLEKETDANAQVAEVDAQASASGRVGASALQPKKSCRLKVPDNLPGTRSTRSNPNKGGIGGKDDAKGGKGGKVRITK